MNTQARTFDNHDQLSRKSFAENLTKAIEADYVFHEESYVLSLNSPVGTGKSDFITMWMDLLNSEDNKPSYTTAFINAWETDYIDEPLIPIMHALIKRARESKEISLDVVKNLEKSMGVFCLSVNQIARHVTGLDFEESLSKVNEKEMISSGHNLFNDFELLKSSLSSTKDALKTLVESCEKKPFFVFVDELDRAKPDYSVKFLERIKHFFGVQGIVFVIAVHKEQLASSMKTIYGEGLDFDGYYRRFITQEAKLPSIDEAGLLKFIDRLISKTFTNGIPIEGSYKEQLNKYLCILINVFQPSLRDLNYSFYIVRRYLKEGSNQKTIRITWVYVLFFMVFLLLNNESIYEEFGKNGINSNNESLITSFFTKLSIKFSNPKDSILNFIIANFLISLENDNNSALITRIFQAFNNGAVQHNNILNNARNDLNSSENAYRTLYNSLENWKKAF
jgi:tRNA A37 threonylcarbamoyladenosine biosynthesis protein TsaE